MALPRGPIEPPLVTLNQTLTSLKRPVSGVASGIHGDPAENFKAYARREPPDLDARSFGTWEHLAALYKNAMLADLALVELYRAVAASGADPAGNQRAHEAGVNLHLASILLHAALVLHMRPEGALALMAMTQTRSALESTGRATLIALGSGDEVHRWKEDRLPPGECLPALGELVARVGRDRAEPARLYGWLCDFTHMSFEGVGRFRDTTGAAQVHAYAAMAYVSWLAALAAELVTGVPRLAELPTAMPAEVPWGAKARAVQAAGTPGG